MPYRLLLFLSAVLLLIACTAAPPGPETPPTPTPVIPPNASDEEAILALLRAEAQGVVSRDMALLAAIWAEDAVVVDAKHTPDDPSDDTRWEGIDAVLDRYVTLVFPGNPTYVEPADVTITIDGDRAEAVSTTQIGAERSPGGDRWTFVKRDGVWRIQSLVYNLEPASSS